MPTDIMSTMMFIVHVGLVLLVLTVLVVLRRMTTKQAEDRQHAIEDLSDKAAALAKIASDLQATEHEKEEAIHLVAQRLEETNETTRDALPDIQATSDDTNVRVREIEKKVKTKGHKP